MGEFQSALVVDQDIGVINQVRQTLKNYGILEITEIQETSKAIDLLKDGQVFDLAIVDIKMPNIAGTAFLQMIRKHENPKIRDMAILVLCGMVRRDEAMLLTEFGFTDYLFKPLHAKTLEKKLIEMEAMHISPESERNYIKNFYSALSSNNFRLAESLVQKKIEEEPESKRCLLQYAEVYSHLEKYDECHAKIKELFEKDPNYLPGLNLLSKLLIKEKRFNEALDVLEKAKSLSPQNIERLITLGEMYIAKDSPHHAENNFKDALNLNPQNIDAQFGLGKSLAVQGRIIESKEIFSKLDKYEELVSFFNNKGILYVRAQRYEAGIQLYENAIKIFNNTEKEYLLLYNIALAHCRAGNINRALETIKKCQSKAPKDYLKIVQLSQKLLTGKLDLEPIDKPYQAPDGFLITHDQMETLAKNGQTIKIDNKKEENIGSILGLEEI